MERVPGPGSWKLLAVACWLSLGNAALISADDWPQWRGPQRDGVWRETGVVSKFPSPQLTPRWRAEIGAGYSGPTVADGRVYVTDRLTRPEQVERVHCFDARSGEPVWSFSYPCPYEGVSYTAGPRAAVTIADGRAFALGTMGHLHVFDAATGKVLWARDLLREYEIELPQWGVSAAPLIDGDQVILQIGGRGAGAGGACIVSLNVADGKERWRALNDRASYSAPILIQQAGRPVLVCWTGERLAGLEPKSGELLWSEAFLPTRMVIAIATPVTDGRRLFVTSFYDGSLMMQLDPQRTAAQKLWRRLGPDEQQTDALHSIMSTPFLEGDYVYGVDSYGELRCLDARTGDRIWEDRTATPRNRWSNIHMVRHDVDGQLDENDPVWMFNEAGELLIARLSPRGFQEIDRAKLISPTTDQLNRRGGVCWSHPAFANRHVFARNDNELVCVDLSADAAADGKTRAP